MRNRQSLVLISILFICAMFWLVPWLTRELGPSRGALALFCFYWFCFCLPFGLIFQGREGCIRNLSLATGEERWVPWSVALQVTVIAISSWTMLPDRVPPLAIALAVAIGAINGFLEEFFWRGAFLEQGRGNIRFQSLGVALFTLWHVPLALAHGVTFPGAGLDGRVALVGGALALGIFWSVIAARTDRIGWPILSHVLTNAITFVGLFSVNFV